MGHCQDSHFFSLINFDESGKTLETRDTFSFMDIEVFNSFHDYQLISIVSVRKYFQRLKVARTIYLINYCYY